MKKVEAIIRPSKLHAVRDELSRIGVVNIAVEPRSRKLKIGVIVKDDLTSEVVRSIEFATRH